MESRISKALERHHSGYNCCQAVACTYSDLVGVPEDELFRMAEGFGAGMGGMESTCGAVSGAVLLAGLKSSGGMQQRTKSATYQLSKEIVEEFRRKNDAIVCKDLKGVDTGKVLRSCDGCIEDACELVEQILFQEK
ncbi:C-GCAxxG-C-C family protein [Caproicibacterium amylolyticum]|mgnify:CR=1 FL=1|jgi:C_GCAxxG_C_C family probable redox protein|uniref:C_GCAxxG_C_C family protein n=1 Tax=Caproicibacterium amylolyticum TaxID=2766537 RepID=A0A7G9WIR1_9FIRM|nr:C-GCAxxG-C-C family protein [Caproicibacterium amylolyticum]MBE6722653.1 C_GCAxxG_C_C family protein [Oscillospiraceae bacterium]QNO18573.1 C_GCAxxG_C_C family protein [Caproicibacterium amylolyticum]